MEQMLQVTTQIPLLLSTTIATISGGSLFAVFKKVFKRLKEYSNRKSNNSIKRNLSNTDQQDSFTVKKQVKQIKINREKKK